MKVPQTPPDFDQLQKKILHEFDVGKLTKILTTCAQPTHNGRYIHWEKARHVEPPSNLTHEQWWFALKTWRRPMQKQMPLKSVKSKPFFYAIPEPAQQILHTLDRDAAGQILISDPIPNSGMRDQYVITSLMEEAITSSQIEGAATTRVVAKEMLRSGRKPRDKNEQMILNNYLAMQQIRRLRGEPINRENILNLHRILTQDTLNTDAVGRIRKSDEPVVVEDAYAEILHTPPPATELDQRLEEMCRFANGETPNHWIHPVLRSIMLHFWLAYDHPFVDGNGRCARALFYWSMLKHGYWVCEFISISQVIKKAHAKYGRAFLYTETDDNDLTYFILYHLDLLRRAIDLLHEYVQQKTAQIRTAEVFFRKHDALNHRQIALLSHALRHPNASYTIEGHRVSHSVAFQTARSDLLNLAAEGLLELQKRGKTFYFFPAKDLASKARKP